MMFYCRALEYAKAWSGEMVATPWRQWFAWYPINDCGGVYWLMWVEWRVVIGKGYPPERPSSRHLEYRRLGETHEMPLSLEAVRARRGESE